MIFAENLKTLRKKKDLSLCDLARLSDVSPSNISSFEHGTKKPSFRTLIKFCASLNCTPNDLFAGIKFTPPLKKTVWLCANCMQEYDSLSDAEKCACQPKDSQ